MRHTATPTDLSVGVSPEDRSRSPINSFNQAEISLGYHAVVSLISRESGRIRLQSDLAECRLNSNVSWTASTPRW